jgi:hypothetical protein
MEALRVNLDITSWNVGTRALAIGAVVSVFLISMYMEGVFGFDDVRPETLLFAMLSVICPTLFIGFYFQRLGICAAGKIITLIGLPIGILSGTLNTISIFERLSNLLGIWSLTGICAFISVTGAMLSVIAHPWSGHIPAEKVADSSDRREVFLVCLGAVMMLMLFCELYANSFSGGYGGHSFATIMSHQWPALFLLSTILLLILLAPNGQRSYLNSVSVGCVISMGLGIGFSTAYYFSGHLDPATLGISLAFALVIITYSSLLYTVTIIYRVTQGEYALANLGKMNWHMAEIYVFYIFLTMTPPSLFETFMNESEQFEQLEERLLELEQREADRLLKSGE